MKDTLELPGHPGSQRLILVKMADELEKIEALLRLSWAVSMCEVRPRVDITSVRPWGAPGARVEKV